MRAAHATKTTKNRREAPRAKLAQRYEVRLNLYNLTDKNYYIGGYNNSPNRVLPGAPLSAALLLL